jgi:hypothetical protein
MCTFVQADVWHLTELQIIMIVTSHEGVSKIFRTDAVKVINITTKRVWKLPTSTQLRATWHTDPLDMVLPSTSASRYHNRCIDGGTGPEYFGYTSVPTFCMRFVVKKYT